MPDFAPNYTARYRIRYSSLGKSHSMVWRLLNTVVDPTGIAAKVGLFLNDLSDNLWSDFAILGADFAEADSDVFLPAPLPGAVTGAVNISGSVSNDASVSICFPGRSATGGKARMFLYGTNFGAAVRTAIVQDWIVKSSENAAISAAIVRLNETAPAIVANDNGVAVWYEYVDVKYNDRWVRRARRG